MRFKIGQEVVCTNSIWSSLSDGRTGNGPKKNDIVTVLSQSPEIETFIELAEHRGNYYNEIFFEPVVPTETIKELFVEEAVTE